MPLTIAPFTVPNMNGYPGTTCILRIYYAQGVGLNFIAVDGAIVEYGEFASNQGAYISIPCTIASNIIAVPTFTIPTTDDSSAVTSTASAVWFDEDTTQRDNLFSQWVIGASLGPMCSFEDLWIFNNSVQVPNPSTSFYTVPQIDALLRELIALGGTARDLATMVNGQVTVNFSLVSTSSIIMVTSQDDGVTGTLRVDHIVPGVSFNIVSDNFGDNGIVGWTIWLTSGGGGGITSIKPGGVSGAIQYNNNNLFGGITGATSDGNTVALTSPSITPRILDSSKNAILDLLANSIATGSITINRIGILNGDSGVDPQVVPQGNDANIGVRITSKGSGFIHINRGIIETLFDTNGLEILGFLIAAAATSFLEIGNSSTDTPGITAAGSNADISIVLTPKGAGTLRLSNGMLSFGPNVDASTPELKVVGTTLQLQFSDGSALSRLALGSASVGTSVQIGSAGNSGMLELLGSDGATIVQIAGPSTGSSYAVTMPTAQGAANTFLQNDGGGDLTWGSFSGASQQSFNSNATTTIDFSSGTAVKIRLLNSITTLNLTNLAAGMFIVLTLQQAGGGSKTVAFGASVKFPGAVAPTLTTTNGAIDILTFACFDAATIYLTSIELDVR